MKKSELKRYKRFTANVIGFIGVILLIYLSVPFFFDYEKNRQVIEKKILHNFGLNIKAKDKTKYSFLPSPRINLYNGIIQSGLIQYQIRRYHLVNYDYLWKTQ